MDASDAPYFVDLVKDRMLDKYSEKDLLSQQYRIFTTLDLELQRMAYQAVREGAENVDTLLAKRRQRKVKLKKGESPPPLVINPGTECKRASSRWTPIPAKSELWWADVTTAPVSSTA